MLAIALLTIALALVMIAALPTTQDIIRYGNDIDPLRREIEQENESVTSEEDQKRVA